MGQFFAWTVAPRAVRIVLSNSSGLKSAAVTRLLLDRGADVVFDDGAVPSSIDRDDARSADRDRVQTGRPASSGSHCTIAGVFSSRHPRPGRKAVDGHN